MRYTTRVLKCDEPTPNTGKIYPTDEVKKAIEVYMKAKTQLGELDNGGEGITVNLDRVSHKIVDTYVDDEGWWVAEIETLGTPMGIILTQLIEADITPALRPRLYGNISETSNFRISDLQIISIDVAVQQ